MTSINNGIQKFISESHKQINGWFFPGDWQAFIFLNQLQLQFGISGDLCEVGVYQGKSLVFLSMLKRLEENLLGFDLFTGEDETRTRQNLASFGSTDQVFLHKIDTAEITIDYLKERIPRPLRFLHIDAGHEYFEVLEQLHLYTPFLQSNAIIAMDDTEDREFPGVSAALHSFCNRGVGRQFVPFCVGANKKYYCLEHLAGTYQKGLIATDGYKDRCRLSRLENNNILILNSKLPVENQSILKQISDSEFPYLMDQSEQDGVVDKYSQRKFGSGRS